MKVGIITFYRSHDNYGQLLQCFALQHFLKKHGCTPYLIRYITSCKEHYRSVNKWEKLKNYFFHFRTYANLFLKQRQERLYSQSAKNEKRQFVKFLDKYVTYSDIEYTDDILKTNPPIADAYICGSDQIWGGPFAYYLDFAPDNVRRIAYAASFGGVNSFSLEYEKNLRKLLSKFSFLGIREQSGVNTCTRLGVANATKVVDPTLLLSSKDYDAIRTHAAPKNKFIFVYLLGNPISMKMAEVYQYAKKHKLQVVYVASQGQYDKYQKTWATIGDWIDYIASAELVITNSFHCTVFALHYSTPFVSVPLVGKYIRMNSRITELLEECKLQHRIYNGSLKKVAQSYISFDGFRHYLESESSRSSELLLKSLDLV